MGPRECWGLEEWLYVWLIHAVTGSGINYARKPSGYNNTILPHLHGAVDLDDLARKAEEILSTSEPAYTSVGYQFPRFPKPGSRYQRGGDRFIVGIRAEACQGSGGKASGRTRLRQRRKTPVPRSQRLHG